MFLFAALLGAPFRLVFSLSVWDASCLLEKQVRRAVSQFLREVAFLTWFFLARRCVLVVSSLRYVFLITVLAGFPLAAKNAGVSGEWSNKTRESKFPDARHQCRFREHRRLF